MRNLPPTFYGNLSEWAQRLQEYLLDRDLSRGETLPQPILLEHQTTKELARATTDGVLMFDPVQQRPVYSYGKVWRTFDATANYAYAVTDNAGGGTLAGDINATDFTGQDGAVGTCAQCPVGATVTFYHKGVQYAYAGPRPASYGAGCADTMQADYLTPVGTGTFVALTDTPSEYAANQWPRVNQGGTGLIWDVIQEADVTDLDRVRWRGNWVQGNTYLRNDAALDSPYLMVANQTTTERPGPESLFPPAWDLPDNMSWDAPDPSHIGTVLSGHEYEVLEPAIIRAVAVQVAPLTPPYNHVIRFYSYPTDDPTDVTYRDVSEPLLISDEWVVIEAKEILALPGTTFGVVVDSLDSSGNTVVTGDWTRQASNNSALPTTGDWNTNVNHTTLRIHETDANGALKNLSNAITGTIFEFVDTSDASVSVTYQAVSGPTYNAASGVYQWSVTSVSEGAGGAPATSARCAVTITEPVPSATIYKQATDYWLANSEAWASITGRLELSGVPQTVPNDAFGVRLYGERVAISEHWDYMAGLGGGGSSSGGDGGGATTFRELSDTPVSYAGTGGNLVAVRQDEAGLEFTDVALSSVEIVESGLPTEGWQVWGDVLIQWGVVSFAAGFGYQGFTFPQAFKTPPRVAANAINESLSATQGFTVDIGATTETGSQVAVRFVNGASPAYGSPGFGQPVGWIAIGEAPDALKKPKTVGIIEGGGAPVEIVESGLPGEGWQVWGDVLIQWGAGSSDANAQLVVTYPVAFPASPVITATCGGGANGHFVQIQNGTETPSGCTLETRRYDNADGAQGVRWIAIGEAPEALKKPKTVGGAGGDGGFVQDTGDTMTGQLIIDSPTYGEHLRLIRDAFDEVALTISNQQRLDIGFKRATASTYPFQFPSTFAHTLDETYLDANPNTVLNVSLGDARYGKLQEFHDPTGAASWKIVGDTLECWGIGLTDVNGKIAVSLPKTFARVPTITLQARDQSVWLNAQLQDGSTVNSIDGIVGNLSTSPPSVASNVGFEWRAIGEWDGVS